MKQGNAIDLLGQDDPRAKDIGIIYVSPTDDRRSVLAAILTQEKLERKQIAVVLPTQNKAFQRPADFDDLKNVRRKLQAQIVFIAPGGPGPAEFARQRRFPVYSSLDYYARALRDEAPATGTAPAAAPMPESGRKRGGLFGGGRSAASKDAPPARPAPLPVSLPPLPLAPGRSGTPAASQVPSTPATPPGVQPAGAVEDLPTAPIAGFAATPFDSSDDPDDFRPPSSTPPVTPVGPIVNQGTASTFGPQGVDRTPTNGGPEPLILGQGTKKPRRTVELDRNAAPVVPIAAPVLPDPDEEAPPPPRRFGSKSAPIAAVTAIGAGATLAADAAAKGATGPEASPWQTPATAPTSSSSSAPASVAPLPTPIRTVPPSVPPRQGGRGTSGRGNGRRKAGRGLLLVILLLGTIALCGGIALAAPYLGLHLPLPGSTAAAPAFTINITPDVQLINNTYVISAVTGTPDPNGLQVQARVLTGDAQSTGQTVNATGQRQTAATYAHGFLTFYNSNTVPQTILRTKITSSNGVQVENDATVTIPAGSAAAPTPKTVAATAVVPGASGNIATGVIDTPCCTASGGVAVQNNSPFTGGVDPQNYTIVQQSDITNVSDTITPNLVTKAQAALSAKLGKSERYAENGTCTPTVGSDHNAGDKAPTVTVQVSVHCTREVYETSQIAAVVTQHMSTTVKQTIGANFSGYALLDGQGNATTLATVLSEKQTGIDAQTGEVTLQVQASGTWVYQFTPAVQQQFKTLIQGKTVAQAITILQSQPGVKSVTIQPTSGTLPTDLGQLSIMVTKEHGVAAPGGGSGSGGGAAEGTPVTTPPTVGPLPTGTGVGMG